MIRRHGRTTPKNCQKAARLGSSWTGSWQSPFTSSSLLTYYCRQASHRLEHELRWSQLKEVRSAASMRHEHRLLARRCWRGRLTCFMTGEVLRQRVALDFLPHVCWGRKALELRSPLVLKATILENHRPFFAASFVQSSDRLYVWPLSVGP